MKLRRVAVILCLTLLCLSIHNIGNAKKDDVTTSQVEQENVEDVIEEETQDTEIKGEDFTSTIQEDVETEVQEQETITFRVTAYCACETCCGQWATNRPLDENGKAIVNGASGERLVANVSCASPLPFGTTIELEGLGNVVVHDRTSDRIVNQHGTYICDIYMEDHQAALNFGVKYIEGRIL